MGRYLQEWVNPDSRWLGFFTKMAAITPHAPGMGGNRGWGWVLRGDAHDPLGDLWPESSAAHTGYTRTSVAFDIKSGIWCVLLTNRVHFGRTHDITAFRRRFHNVVISHFGPGLCG